MHWQAQFKFKPSLLYSLSHSALLPGKGRELKNEENEGNGKQRGKKVRREGREAKKWGERRKGGGGETRREGREARRERASRREGGRGEERASGMERR